MTPWGGLINDADGVRRSALRYAGLSGYGGERHQRSLEVEVGYCVLQGVQTRRIGGAGQRGFESGEGIGGISVVGFDENAQPRDGRDSSPGVECRSGVGRLRLRFGLRGIQFPPDRLRGAA